MRRFFARCLKYIVGAGLSLVVGTAWHEGVGHGLVGVLCGGHIVSMKVLGVQLRPTVRWVGRDSCYSQCDVQEISSPTGEHLCSLGGSLSTWFVSVLAVLLLWVRDWPPRTRFLLAWLGIWWIDLLTYTWSSWGLRRCILWGALYSEPYEAAVALGIPGPVFQAFVVGTSALLLVALAARLLAKRQGDQRP